MRLCVDISAMVQQSAGIARYNRALLEHLLQLTGHDEISVFYTHEPGSQNPLLPAPLQGLRQHRVERSPRAWRIEVAGAYLLDKAQDRLVPHIDLFLATDHLLPHLRTIGGILTVHDLSIERYPQYHSLANRLYQQLMLPQFVRRAQRIIVPSEATRADLIAYYRVSPRRISVIAEGVDERFRPKQPAELLQALRTHYGLVHPYILALGTLEPRKNLIGLLEAFALLVHAGRAEGVELVLAGREGWRYGSTLRRIRELGLEQRVRRLGFVPDADLPALLGAAEVVASVSYYEGFGLPALEALACGVPLVASDSGAHPEVVGEAGLLVDPQRRDLIAQALLRALEWPELRARLQATGPVQAAQFSWRRTAEQTLKLCAELQHSSQTSASSETSVRADAR